MENLPRTGRAVNAGLARRAPAACGTMSGGPGRRRAAFESVMFIASAISATERAA